MNVNLLFGENACGKSTVLEAIALAALGPAVNEARIAPRPLVRFIPTKRKPSTREASRQGLIRAEIALQPNEVFRRLKNEEAPATGISTYEFRRSES